MLQKLTVDNFTVFDHAEFEFGMLNVIHGENGTGKTALLKLVTMLGVLTQRARDRQDRAGGPDDDSWLRVYHRALFRTLRDQFAIEQPSELVRWGQPAASVTWRQESQPELGFRIGADHFINAPDDTAESLPPALQPAILIPPREVLSMPANMERLLQEYEVEEETCRLELRRLLGEPEKKWKGQRDDFVDVIHKLEKAVGGSAKSKFDRFRWETASGREVAIALAAEGHRKLAQVALLAARIKAGWILAWDEPEANLNPALVRVAAEAAVDFAEGGVQVFIATHSLHFMRALYLETQRRDFTDTRYFGLHRSGPAVSVKSGADLAETGAFRALDEDLALVSDYMNWEIAAAAKKRKAR